MSQEQDTPPPSGGTNSKNRGKGRGKSRRKSQGSDRDDKKRGQGQGQRRGRGRGRGGRGRGRGRGRGKPTPRRHSDGGREHQARQPTRVVSPRVVDGRHMEAVTHVPGHHDRPHSQHVRPSPVRPPPTRTIRPQPTDAVPAYPRQHHTDVQRQRKEREQQQQREQQRGKGGDRERTSRTPRRRPQRKFFREYLTAARLKEGLASGAFVKGELRINAKARRQCYVTVAGYAQDILLEGDQARNRGMDGDIVCLEIDDESKWKKYGGSDGASNKTQEQPQEVEEEEHENEAHVEQEEEPAAVVGSAVSDGLLMSPPIQPSSESEDEDEKEEKQEENTGVILENTSLKAVDTRTRPTARVVGILEPGASLQQVFGYLKPGRSSGEIMPSDQYIFFVPLDRRIPSALIPVADVPHTYLDKPHEEENANMLFEVSYRPWTVFQRKPFCTLIRHMGAAGDIDVETRILLQTNRIYHDNTFPDEVMEQLRRYEDWSIPKEEYSKRRDFRQQCVFTIDPSTARDLDDALSIRELPNGHYMLGVHIADVTFFFPPDSALDMEAAHRATTVYLVDQVIPMLPRVLCENLCSLNPNVERLAYSVEVELDEDGQVAAPAWFGRSIIRSCGKLDYPTVQDIIEGKIVNGDQMAEDRRPTPESGYSATRVINDCHLLHRLAGARRRKRFEGGSLTLNKTKLSFRLDDSGDPESVGNYVQKEANWLVEEFMLLANRLVADQLVEHAQGRGLLRRHPPPLKAKIDSLSDLCRELGFSFDGATSASLHTSLQDLHHTVRGGVDIGQMVEILLTKPMRPAEYFCVSDNPDFHHYALNFPTYTHFTSPIRRYADVMVHRLLTYTLNPQTYDTLLPEVESVTQVSKNCNSRKLGAKAAQERSDFVYLCLYLRHHPMHTRCVVVDFGQESLTVAVSELDLDKRVHLNDIAGVESIQIQGNKLSTKRLVLKWDQEHGGKSHTYSLFQPIPCVVTTRTRTPIDVAITLCAEGASAQTLATAAARLDQKEKEKHSVHVTMETERDYD